MGLPNILKEMKLLKQQPDYRFVLDQGGLLNLSELGMVSPELAR